MREVGWLGKLILGKREHQVDPPPGLVQAETGPLHAAPDPDSLLMEERQRIGRDLHDGIGQLLGYALNQAKASQALLQTGQTVEAESAVQSIQSAVVEANSVLRSYLLGLAGREALAEGGHFFDHFRAYLASFQKRYTLAVQLSVAEDVRPGDIRQEVEEPLLRILQEALVNAAKHAGAALASVTFQKSGDQLYISVSDNGRGFDTQALSAGEGPAHLGVETMKELAGRIGGRMEIYSRANYGTQVHLKVPIIAETVKINPRFLQSRLFLVDNNPLFLEGLENLLRSSGLTVVGTARNGQSALGKIAQLKPDLVITDIYMDPMDGIELTEKIREKWPDIIVVVLSFAEEPDRVFKVLQAGAAGYLLKTIDLNTLILHLAQIESAQQEAARSGESGFYAARLKPQRFYDYLAKEFDLNDQQMEIIRLVAAGRSYREVASEMYLTEVTIKYHMKKILAKLNLGSKQQVVRILRDIGGAGETAALPETEDAPGL